MKTILTIATILLGTWNIAYAYSLTLDQTDTGSVVISNNAASPTKILTKNQAINRTWLINYSTNVIYVVGSSATSPSGDTPSTFSISLTTGSFYLIGSSTFTWTPDGTEPFTGSLWAVAGGTGGTSLMRVRSK